MRTQGSLNLFLVLLWWVYVLIGWHLVDASAFSSLILHFCRISINCFQWVLLSSNGPFLCFTFEQNSKNWIDSCLKMTWISPPIFNLATALLTCYQPTTCHLCHSSYHAIYCCPLNYRKNLNYVKPLLDLRLYEIRWLWCTCKKTAVEKKTDPETGLSRS